DLLARVGQLPFLFLTGITLFALARRAGARPEHAIYAAVFCFLARPIVEQAVGADVDLVCAATFLTSIYLGVLAIDTNQRRDWALWGVSLGVYAGSKYLAIVYLPVFLLLGLVAVARGVRAQLLWAVPGVAALAAPWYLRNWIVGGSPISPASLEAAGLTIAEGAYTHEAMLNSVFHTTDPGLIPVIVAHAFGTPLLLVWIPFVIAAGLLVARRRQWWPAGYLVAVPFLMVPLYWFG